MKREIQKEMFIYFLKKKRVYKKFLKNMNSDANLHKEDFATIEELVKGGNNIRFSSAFIFSRTEQGSDYWNKLESEWTQFKWSLL